MLPESPEDKVGGKQVYIGVMVKGYGGPGSYDGGDLTDNGSPPGLTFDGRLYFVGTTHPPTTVTVDGKGVRSDGNLSGSVTWTCENP